MKILLLGHKGMLGNCAYKRFNQIDGFEVFTTELRWPSSEFIKFVRSGDFDFIVNCIAKIPQSNVKGYQSYFTTNFALPIFLASTGGKLIQASSDAKDDSLYSTSKTLGDSLLHNFDNAHIINCSIIGIEIENNRSLLSSFLNSKEDFWVGYSNYMWDGITTLEWVKIAEKITNGTIEDKVVCPYSKVVSKYDMLVKFRETFDKNIAIRPSPTPIREVEKKTKGIYCGDIGDMLVDLRNFYNEER